MLWWPRRVRPQRPRPKQKAASAIEEVGVNNTAYSPFFNSSTTGITELSATMTGVTLAVIALLALHMGWPLVSLRTSYPRNQIIYKNLIWDSF